MKIAQSLKATKKMAKRTMSRKGDEARLHASQKSKRAFGAALKASVVAACLSSSAFAQATPPGNFTTTEVNGNACVDSGGVLGSTNLFTDLDGGSFGTGSGAADEFYTAADPGQSFFPDQIEGGNFVTSFSGFMHGDYAMISNMVTDRNRFQHDGPIYDPVNGVAGRFLVSDANAQAPEIASQITGLTAGDQYEMSFWVANSEPNGNPNNIGVFASENTGDLFDAGNEFYQTGSLGETGGPASTPALWQKFSVIYTHTSAASTVNFGVKVLETGSAGRDIWLDEVAVFECLTTTELEVTKATGAQGALNADGTFTQEFSITLTNTGGLTVTNPTLADDIEALFGDAFDPSTFAADGTSGVTAVPVVTPDAGNTGTAPSPVVGFDGNGTDGLISGGSLEPDDVITVTFSVLLDAFEMAGVTTTNTVTADGTPPTGTTLTFVGTDENSDPTTDGTASSSVTPPSVPTFELDTSSLAGCTGAYSYWQFDASTPNLPGGFTYINSAGGGTREDGGASNAQAFYFGGWTNSAGGVWAPGDGILARSSIPAATGSGIAPANVDLGDFDLENDTAIVDTTYIAYRYQTEPNTLETVTMNDTAGLEHQMFAALDAAGNLISTPSVTVIGHTPSAGTYTMDVAVPASGVFFVHVWRVDMDQLGGSLYPDCGADLYVEKTLPTEAPSAVSIGDTVTFDITVTNDGPQDATNVSVNDLIPAGLTPTTNNGTVTAGVYDDVSGDWDIGTLADGESATLTIEGVVTIAAGTIVTNNVTAPTLDQIDLDITPDDLTEAVTVIDPSIDLVKSVSDVADTNGNGILGDAGDTVTYLFQAENTGDTALAGVTVSDADLAALDGTFTLTQLTTPDSSDPVDGQIDLAIDSGLVDVATATYVLHPNDSATGSVTNTATVTSQAVATDAGGNPDPAAPLPGVDPVGDDSDSGTEPDLDADGNPVDIGDPENSDSNGDPSTDSGDDPTILNLPTLEASIALEKSISSVDDTNGNGFIGDVGDTVNYVFTAENTGDTALAGVQVSDADLAALDGTFTLMQLTTPDFNADDKIDLAVDSGPTDVATATYVLALSDFGTGAVTNTATVTSEAVATDASGDPDPTTPLIGISAVEDDSDSGTEPDLDANGDPVDIGDPPNSDGNGDPSPNSGDDPTVLNLQGPEPSVELVKAVTDVDDFNADAPISLRGFIGDRITYEFSVENTGNTALANVGITDDKLGLSNDPVDSDVFVTAPGRNPGELLPGDIGTLTFVYTITAADVAAGFAENIATADGQPVATNPATGLPIAGMPLIDPNTGAAFDPVEDISDTGSQERPDDSGNIVPVPNPGDTDTNGTPGDDGDEPTVVRVPFLAVPDTGLVITKTVTDNDTDVMLGDIVPYTITVENTNAGVVAGFLDVVDALPVGMTYVPGTAIASGTPVVPTISGQRIIFEDQLLQPNTPITYTLSTRVDATAPSGDLTNTASMRDPVTNALLSNIATATVGRDPEAVFDCAPVIGKVFDDLNMDGYQNDPNDRDGTLTDDAFPYSGKVGSANIDTHEEPGIAGARVVTPTGTVITTDEYGRFHVPCAELPGSIGTNFTLKLDTRSLPTGYRVTTENPRSMRLTAGIMTELNFGAAIGRLLDVDLTAAAFDQTEPAARLEQGLDRLLGEIADTPGVIKLTYFRGSESKRLAEARLDKVEEYIESRWSAIGRYRLIVEQTIVDLQ